MGEMIKKPYEISVWEDRLVTENNHSYYKEIKLAVIGSDKMDSPNRVFDPVFTKNVNGEKSLTFSLAFKYSDPYTGELIENPFIPFLINERKIKLFYDDEWYEFIIKNREEDSEKLIFTYTARELFSLELGKIGYAIDLNPELNNNQGTAVELAEKVLENTDWIVDKENSDLLKQFVQDPIYECTVNEGFTCLNLETNELVSIGADETIFVFYSFIKDRNTDYVQFIRSGDAFVIDDNNVISATNYRFVHNNVYQVSYIETDNEVTQINFENSSITVNGIYYKNQAYRLVYGQKTTYDNIMGRTVDVYEAESLGTTQTIYHYLDYDYITSDIVTSFITNGTNFDILNDDSIQGWYSTTPVTSVKDGKPVLQPIKLATYPKFDAQTKATDFLNLGEVNQYLELKFAGARTSDNKNTYFNSGIGDASSIIDHISAGEEFVLRMRGFYTNKEHGDEKFDLINTSGVRLMVALYTVLDNQEFYLSPEHTASSGGSIFQVSKGGVILDFTDNFFECNNYITTGSFDNEKTKYIIDNVVQTPSTLYIYKSIKEGQEGEYVYSPSEHKFKLKDSSFINYYATTARAKTSINNEKLSDPSTQIGIFLYTNDGTNLANGTNYVYLQDIQLTRCYRDGENVQDIVTIGNIPTALSVPKHCFYLKPLDGMTQEQVNTYGTLDYLCSENGYNIDNVKALRNEKGEKVLSIEESKSNCFNILQSICETFECWLHINVEHEEDGSIKLDDNYTPIKKIAFKQYSGKNNFSGFKYGINLNSIQRSFDSESFVTKMIVDPVQSEYSDTGSLSISAAPSNLSKEEYILNFSYYLNQGLIANVEECNQDLLQFSENLAKLNKENLDYVKEYTQLSAALVDLKASVNTYSQLLKEARDEYTEALITFADATGKSYSDYVYKNISIEELRKTIDIDEKTEDLIENETIANLIAQLYITSVTINNYAGIFTNLKKDYEDKRLKCYGAREYGVSITVGEPPAGTTNYTTQVVVDDYFEGFRFSLSKTTTPEIIFETSYNDRIFFTDSPTPYYNLIIEKVPEHYDVVLYVNNIEQRISNLEGNYVFKIYDEDQVGGVTRKLKLVPKDDFKEENGGILNKSKEILEQKKIAEKNFYKKYSRFIQEGTWSSNNYIDPELYYLDAIQVSNTSAQPQVEYTINVAEVSGVENLENYTFDVGDKTYIEDTHFFGYQTLTISISDGSGGTEDSEIRMPVKEEIIISAVEWHLDSPEENVITVQNYKTQFEDLFQRISATVQTLQYNEATYPKTSAILDPNGTINAQLLADSIAQAGTLGYNLVSNGSIKTTEDGFLIQNLQNPANRVIIGSSGIQISQDGGQTWSTALSAEGVATDKLTSGIINTQNIWLMDGDSPSFRWDKSGLNAYGLNQQGEEEYDLKTYVRFDKYGLYGIKNDENYVASSLEDIKNKAHFGITWDGFFIKNSYTNGYVSITSDNDFQVIHNIDKTTNFYESTTDEIIDPEKTYYILVDDEYIAVEEPIQEDIGLYYDCVSSTVDSISAEKIKIGALEFNNDGQPTKYGIVIKNDDDEPVFVTGDDGNLTITGTINANAGNIGGLSVDNSILLMQNIALEPGVGIYSTKLISDYDPNVEIGSDEDDLIFFISDEDGSAYFNNVTARGTIYAEAGDFSGEVTVGHDNTDETKPYIVIDGLRSLIKSSNYKEGAGQGWMINKDGDAVFNNITARGAIKTAVFEYAEIQAVGGVFIFRPSSTIKKARLAENGTDLILKVEKPALFAKVTYTLSTDTEVDGSKTYYTKGNAEYIEVINPTGNPHELEYYEKNTQFNSWCKISNYTTNGDEPDINSILLTNGLTHIYEVIAVDLNEAEITLADGINFINAVIKLDQTIDDVLVGLEGGALVDMGRQDGSSNYGIGVNSSDNTVNLPARAISLFETVIHPNTNPKVSYNYRGILGTLPTMSDSGSDAQVASFYNQNMAGTQGIYTDNMYIGDDNQYVAFYEDGNHQKQLKIKANQIMFEISDPEPGQDPWKDISEVAEGAKGEDAINVEIDSSGGNVFINGIISTILRCFVYKGGVDITHDNNYIKTYTWKKINIIDGSEIPGWTPTPVPLEPNAIRIGVNDVNSKAVFQCTVNVEEA